MSQVTQQKTCGKMDTLLIYDVDDLNKSSLPSSIKMKQNRFTVALPDQVNVSSQHFLRRCLLLGPIIVVSKLNHLFSFAKGELS